MSATCAWCPKPAVTRTSRLNWPACQPHADEDARLEARVKESETRLAAVEAECATAERGLVSRVAEAEHFSIGLMIGRVKEIRGALGATS